MGGKLKKFSKKRRFMRKMAKFCKKRLFYTEKLIDTMTCQYVFVEFY